MYVCLGTGSVVAAIKVPARREPHVIGKPGTAMFDLLHEIHGLDASRSMMVGDRLVNNIVQKDFFYRSGVCEIK